MTRRWLLVSGDFVPTGGMDAALLGLASYLAASDTVEIVAHRVARPLRDNPNVLFHRAVRPAGKHLLGAPFLRWAGFWRARSLRNSGARIVCNGGNSAGSDINWVHYVHAAYAPQSTLGSWRRIKQWLTHRLNVWSERRSILGSRIVVCNSVRTASDVSSALSVPADRIHVVYYGSDPARFPEVSGEERTTAREELTPTDGHRPFVVFVGSLGDRRKGFDTLYHAWKHLVSETEWDGLLWVVGQGAERHLWEARSRDDGVSDSIRFLGFRTDVPRILAAADVLVHPARYEAYGLGVHEAICRGIPAIVSRSAGIAELYPTELQALLLSDPNSASELAERLQFWRSHLEAWPEKMNSFARRLRQRTWDDMSADFVEAVNID